MAPATAAQLTAAPAKRSRACIQAPLSSFFFFYKKRGEGGRDRAYGVPATRRGVDGEAKGSGELLPNASCPGGLDGGTCEGDDGGRPGTGEEEDILSLCLACLPVCLSENEGEEDQFGGFWN